MLLYKDGISKIQEYPIFFSLSFQLFPINMAVEVSHDQGCFFISQFQEFAQPLINVFGGIWYPVANSHQYLRPVYLNFTPDALLEGLTAHIPSLHCINIALNI